ncbi:MAG: hypothetical protein D6729_19525 [Deltaproteobacteria bacterium]|nr:MAG: hypothetical protein D6729_19525 [Deltaproteobacteria bacterium]
MRRLVLTLCLLLAAACATAGRPRPLPDEPETKAVLDVLEAYRRALEAKDMEGLLRLVSREYLDDLGTPESDDDIDYDALPQKLARDFEKVTALRVDLQVLRMRFDDEKRHATVDYRYDVRFQLSMPSGQKWHNALDVNRMELKREGTTWKITRGL